MWDMFAAPEVRAEEDGIPSVYIDKSLVQKAKGSDGVAVADVDSEGWKKFEVYAERIRDDSMESEELHLNIKLERVTHGYLINSALFITEYQWHTVIFKDVKSVLCAICDNYSPLCETKSHIEGSEHTSMLEKFQPLRSYDLSITRKIRNKLHCGLCNELIEIANEDAHYTSKMHESNFLFALNKASDIVYDTTTEKSDCFHFTDNAVSNGINTIKDNTFIRNYGQSETDIGPTKSEMVEFDLYKEFDMKPEDFVDYYEFDGPSYANVASKPKVIDDMELEIAGKKVVIKCDSWHMIVAPKPNVFYCMACTTCDRIRCKADHILSDQHLAKLEECRIVEKYEEYIVRQVNSSLYHCGFCNNLQFVYNIEEHIKEKHKKSIKNVIENTTPKKMPQKPKNVEKITQSNVKSKETNNMKNTKANDITKMSTDVKTQRKAKQDVKPNQNMKIDNKIHDQIQMKKLLSLPNIFDKIDIYPFGYKMTITVLSYNVICHRDDMKFYCGLCNIICREDVIKLHIHEMGHIMLLQNTPFIAPFTCNLIRGIREALHCAICNIPVQPRNIYAHNVDKTHVFLLNQAVGLNENPSVLNNAPISPNIVINPSNSLTNGTQIANTLNNASLSSNLIYVTLSSQTPTNIPLSSQTPTNIPLSSQTQNNATFKTNVTQSSETPINATAEKNINNLTTVTNSPKQSAKHSESNSVTTPNNSDLADMSVDDLNISWETQNDSQFDLEEFVYIKLKNTFIKISNTAYNTLVPLGDGSRFCFVCSKQEVDLQKHVDSRKHLDNIEKYRFLDRYEEHLLRQIFLMYHCAICNVIIPRKHIKTHLDWPTHLLQSENTQKIVKKMRKNDIKTGIKQINVNTQKENIYLNEKETQIKILHYICVKNCGNFDMDSRQGKVVIFKHTVFKISWTSFNGISSTKDGFRCIICQADSNCNDIEVHVNSEWHVNSLNIQFEKKYDGALIRKINDTTVNCVTCNIELFNRDSLIAVHIHGKKHMKTFDSILNESANTDTFADCDENIIIVN